LLQIQCSKYSSEYDVEELYTVSIVDYSHQRDGDSDCCTVSWASAGAGEGLEGWGGEGG